MKQKKPNKSITVDTVSVPDENITSHERLTKAVQDLLTVDDPDVRRVMAAQSAKKKRVRKNKVIFQTDYERSLTSQLGDTYDKPLKRLTDKDLLDLAQTDNIIAAIINTRINQMTSFGDFSESLFDKGIRVLDTKSPKEADYPSKEAYQAECDRRRQMKDSIQDWILHCGTQNQAILDQVYEDTDKTLKHCTLKQYIQAQTHSLLALGRCGRQNIRNVDTGEVLAFRPVPMETFFPVRPDQKVFLVDDGHNEECLQEVKSYNEIPEGKRPIAYVQKIEHQQHRFFTERDLHITYYQIQARMDLNGYPYSPIEYALFMTYMHQHSMQYLRNQFVKGVMSRSIVVVSSKDPEIEISPEDLGMFKRELQNISSRTNNSSSLPVVSGPIDVQVRPLDLSPKDLEWQQLEQTIIRCLCSAFQIAPNEVGFGLLGDPAGLSQGNKDYELVQGEERGLRVLVDCVLEDLNDVMYDYFTDAKKEGFKLVAVGIGSETREAMLQRLNVEQTLTSTLNDLFSQSEKNITAEYGGDVPLNPLWHQNVVKYMKFGKFLEVYMGEKGAAQKPEYDFFIDPVINQTYQQMKTGGLQAMAAQNQGAVMQLQQGAMQMQQTQQQPQGQPGVAQGAQQQPSMQQPEKSLQDHYDQSEKLNKSLLESWLNLPLS